MLVVIIALLAGIALGVAIGCPIYERMLRKKINGALRIDRSDPDDEPYLFLELNEKPDKLEDTKYITLEVVAKNYLSQD